MPYPRWLRVFFWICIVLAVAVVLRRVASFAFPARNAPAQMASVEAAFMTRKALTLAHILPAGAFVLITPFVLKRGVGRRRALEAVLYALGVIVGLTAYAMSGHPVGGNIERAAVLFFNTLYLFALMRSWLLWRACSFAPANRWLLRAVGILLGIATTRPVMGVFFATMPLTHLQPQQFFGIAFWIGFSINTLVVELWLRSRHASPDAAGGLATGTSVSR